MMNYTVTIDVEVFEELVRIAERVEILKRYNDSGEFMTSNEIFTVLGFEQKAEDDPEFYLNKKEDGNNENS